MSEFQRARRPDQVEARREAIIDVAGELLANTALSEISMRELSRQVGLSSSNVARYFPTREAVFLEVLDRARREWLADLEPRLPAVTGDVAAIAELLAASLAERPMLCELLSNLAGVLERNVSTEVVHDYKLRSQEHNERAKNLFQAHIPGLSEDNARELSATLHVYTAGVWPLANPGRAVLEAVRDPRLRHSRVDFVSWLGRLIVVLISGYQHGA